jgi:hypothetical protein
LLLRKEHGTIRQRLGGPQCRRGLLEKKKSFNLARIETPRLSSAQASHYRLDTIDSQITRQAMYRVILRRVRVTIVALEKQ